MNSILAAVVAVLGCAPLYRGCLYVVFVGMWKMREAAP